MICPKTNNKPDLSLCPSLCLNKCDLISARGKGREIGEMLRNIVKYSFNRVKNNRPLIDRRKI
jgi:hypothetical protein